MDEELLKEIVNQAVQKAALEALSDELDDDFSLYPASPPIFEALHQRFSPLDVLCRL